MQDLTSRLQWRHLRLIHAIDEYGQLSVAADHLAITQPAASRMLAEVEQMVGQPLFARTSKGMVPTAIAEVLIRHAGGLLRALASTADEVAAFGAGKTGRVRVGSVTGAAIAYVVPAVHALKQDVEGADVYVGVGPSDTLMEGLLNGEYDFILSRVPNELDPRLFEIMDWRNETAEFLVRSGHKLTQIARPSITDLAGFGWVAQATGTPMRKAVEEAFLAHGVPLPEDIVTTTSLLVMIAYLQISDSISPVSSEVGDLVRSTGVGGIQSITVQQPLVISPYHLIQRKSVMINPLAQRLRNLVVDGLSKPLA
ncbi:LysR family transcriptional regulator [Pseudosulfitobacter sp. DSM 107133]|uniref:LysR family transcriptional regulator n=1 Tax=Pseudosulfitobacter sp. DSM 107133 TaxID=2883100 RepID=UPI000DF426DB|nr:LysR family transcriptional regulator [Pseudosulfitobacter sp. DSM 107133]UOA29174.1 HTH-type transcriptional regulator GbpR [Pseudosulfitobacter sp. DSM 107133]